VTVRRNSSVVVVTLIILVIAAGYVFPFYLISMNSFKGYLEVITSFLKLPKDPSFENFQRAWILMKLPRPFLNTLIICALSIGGSVLLSAMGGYKLERTGDKKSRVLYYYFIFSLVIPFFVIMIPVMRLAAQMGIINSLLGLSLLYIAFTCPFAVFMIHGFTKTIPRETEDAAIIDGCGPFMLFFRIALPLLQPAVMTLVVLYMLWIWNDFALPYLLVADKRLHTVTVAAYYFAGTQMIEWDLIIAGMTLITAPIIIFYFFAQKYIQRGIATSGLKS